MLSVVAVFVPSFFMTGVSRSLFVPLSLAVGFAMIASFLLVEHAGPGAVGLAGSAHRQRGARRPRPDWVDRLRDRLGALLTAGAGARGARGGLRAGHRRCSSRRRPDARARDVSAERQRRRSSCASARRPARSSSPPSGSVATCSTRSTQAAGPEHVDITLGYVGVQPSSYPINTIFLWTGGSHEGVLQVALTPDAPVRPRALPGDAARRVPASISRRAVLVRAGRHRQPHHELQRADAGGSRRDGSRLRGEPCVCGQGARLSSPRSRRCATCSTARRSTTRHPGQRRSPDGGAARRHRGPGGPLVRRGHLVEPVRRPELLGRSAHGHRVPGPGAGAAAADDDPRGPARRAGHGGWHGQAAPRRSRPHRERDDRRRSTTASTASAW